MQQDAEAKETAIRVEAQKQAEAGVQEKLAGMERSRQESEAALQARVKEAGDAKVAAQQSNTANHVDIILGTAEKADEAVNE